MTERRIADWTERMFYSREAQKRSHVVFVMIVVAALAEIVRGACR